MVYLPRQLCILAIFSASLLMAGCTDSEPQLAALEVEQEPPPTEGAPVGATRLRSVYVPAYSHLPRASKPHKSLLSILLSVRNVDSNSAVTLTHVDYFHTSGHRVRRYLKGPRTLRPLETAEFQVDTYDDAGGSGANFLVFWEGPSDAHPLLTESIMWGAMGPGFVSFVSRGVELDRRPDPEVFMLDESDLAPPASDKAGARP